MSFLPPPFLASPAAAAALAAVLSPALAAALTEAVAALSTSESAPLLAILMPSRSVSPCQGERGYGWG